MALAEQFDPLELIRRDVAETWLVMEKSSKRRLLLHRFREDTGLRQRLLSMDPADLIMLVSAEQEKDFAIVVTHDFPPLRQFSQWVNERSDAAAAAQKEQVSTAAEKTPPAAFDPDRTQLMTSRAPVPKASGGVEPMFEPPASPPPGDFTRLFQAPVAGEAKTPTSSGNAPSRTPEPLAEPGEFTRTFEAFPATSPVTSGSTAAAKPNAPEKKAAEGEPGEFTRLFYAPPKPQAVPSEPTVVRPNRASPKTEGPGEFTTMFETPFATKPEPERASVGESLPMPPVASKPSGGEFTKVFGRFSQEPEPDPALDRGGATGVFSRPQGSASSLNQASPPVGPSEYTVMMRAPGPIQEAPPPTPEATSPKEEVKPPPASINAKNAVVLTIILAVLVAAAVALLLYFLKR